MAIGSSIRFSGRNPDLHLRWTEGTEKEVIKNYK